jgi:hypothetical protein
LGPRENLLEGPAFKQGFSFFSKFENGFRTGFSWAKIGIFPGRDQVPNNFKNTNFSKAKSSTYSDLFGKILGRAGFCYMRNFFLKPEIVFKAGFSRVEVSILPSKGAVLVMRAALNLGPCSTGDQAIYVSATKGS